MIDNFDWLLNFGHVVFEIEQEVQNKLSQINRGPNEMLRFHGLTYVKIVSIIKDR